MNVSVNIYTPDKDVGCNISIEQIEGTNNYNYRISWVDDMSDGSWTGVIFNHEGNYYELVKKVMNGRDLS